MQSDHASHSFRRSIVPSYTTVNISAEDNRSQNKFNPKSLTWPNHASNRQSIENKVGTDTCSHNPRGAEPSKCVMDHLRRTSSLDTFLCSPVYLSHYEHFRMDRATQTPAEWTDGLPPQPFTECLHEEFHIVRNPILVARPSPPSLNVEGLSQEIQRVLRSGLEPVPEQTQFVALAPDGHRAPIADLFSKVWTPIAKRPDEGLLVPTPSNGDSSENFEDPGSSPHNISREPPDGCDRIKFIEEPRYSREQGGGGDFVPIPFSSQPNKCKFEPSQQSAFYPLARPSFELDSPSSSSR